MEKQKIPCVVIGVAGRMGQRICSLLSATDDLELVGATETALSSDTGKTVKEALGLLDIRLLDHFVVGEGSPVSMAARGML